MTKFISKPSDSAQEPKWRSKPIPLLMVLRGYLPRFLGGEMVYDAVVRTNHFGSTFLLTDYLMEQCTIAIQRDSDFHISAIRAHLHKLLDAAVASKKAAIEEPSP